jgi:hypothetical protein
MRQAVTILADQNKHSLFGKPGLVDPPRFVHPLNYTIF